jgi:hypothetical protein
MGLPYPAWSVVYGEQPTAAKWSELGANDDALAAGTGFNSHAIPSSAINFGGAGAGLWWEEIGRTALTVAGDTITISSLPARKYLRVLFSIINASGAISLNLTFNNDTGSNYGWRKSVSSAADLGLAPAQRWTLDVGGGTTTFPVHGSLDIVNISAQEKVGWGMLAPQAGGGATSAPIRIEFAGKWAYTSGLISRLDFTNLDAGDYAIGSEVIVLGHN